MTEQKKLLIEILEIIDYEGEKEVFADLFADLIFEQAIYELIRKLPESRRDSVTKKYDANTNNPTALASLARHNFTAEQIANATETAAQKAIADYLKSLQPTLTEGQRDKLEKLSREYTVAN